MRVYGRVTNPDGSKTWVTVQTAPNGDNTAVYVTALVQFLKLNINESPFYANCGIPSYPSVHRQIPPDFYAQKAQRLYAQYFGSLAITKTSNNPPTYQVSLLTKQGGRLSFPVAV